MNDRIRQVCIDQLAAGRSPIVLSRTEMADFIKAAGGNPNTRELYDGFMFRGVPVEMEGLAALPEFKIVRDVRPDVEVNRQYNEGKSPIELPWPMFRKWFYSLSFYNVCEHKGVTYRGVCVHGDPPSVI